MAELRQKGPSATGAKGVTFCLSPRSSFLSEVGLINNSSNIHYIKKKYKTTAPSNHPLHQNECPLLRKAGEAETPPFLGGVAFGRGGGLGGYLWLFLFTDLI